MAETPKTMSTSMANATTPPATAPTTALNDQPLPQDCMTWRRLDFLPCVVFAWFFGTFALCYGIAVYMGHVPYFLPYISDCGTLQPESCIFGQLLNIGSVILILLMLIRYYQVELIANKQELPRIANKVSGWSVIMGISACLGISVVGNFQETQQTAVHILGAVMAFGGGSVFFCLQTILSFKMLPHTGCLRICYLRVVLNSTMILLFLLSTIAATLSFKDYDPFPGILDFVYWTADRKGYIWHVASSACEWLLALNIFLYIFTFRKEFSQITFTLGTVQIK